MIIKMTKYSFILLNGETEDFLKQIQELGVMDITRSAKPIDEASSAMLDKAAEIKHTMAFLQGLDFSKDADWTAIEKASANAPKADNPMESAIALKSKLDELQSAYNKLHREVALRAPWGDFDKKSVDGLAENGYVLHYYTLPKKRFNAQWAEQYPLQVIHDNGSTVWFVVIGEKGQEYSFPEAETDAPAGSSADAEAEMKVLSEQIVACKGALLQLKASVPQLQADYDKNLVDLDFYLAKASSEAAVDNMLSLLVGFAPTEQDAELEAALNQMDVFYLKEAATKDDNPPIKLKNGWFGRKFEVLTGMYGMPVYDEMDPTPILSFFFMLFFAICLGDAGYGLVLLLFGICIEKKWVKIKMFENIGSLISILGTATFVVGMVLGTFFGVNLVNVKGLPEGYHKLLELTTGNFPGLPYAFQMVSAIIIGVLHLILAMSIKAVLYTKRFGFANTVSTWGWLLLIVGTLLVVLLGLGPNVTKWALIGVGAVSALGICIFNKPGRNPLLNVGAGLWDTYQMVTGLLGDVLSYIRLYALGLAGGMLGGAFNTLGNMVMGDAATATWQWLPYVLILLIGHVLNILMSSLGAFVHPLRLNFLEYFKNSGYEGKGTAYNPLNKNANK